MAYSEKDEIEPIELTDEELDEQSPAEPVDVQDEV